MLAIRSLFSSPTPIPEKYRANFRHLFFDIGWFGILSGSSLAFISVYATRLGASAFQIGLMSAIPAIMSLLLAIPASRYLQRTPIDKAVFWTSVLYRFGYLLWVPLPWFLNDTGQVWALIIITVLMGIPGTALAVGFNALFAEAVPAEWRGYVAGVRNVMLSITFVLVSLFSGWLLDHLLFPLGYQLVFALGFIGAAMSSYHLYQIRPVLAPNTPRPGTRIGDKARPGMAMRIPSDSQRSGIGLRLLTRSAWRELLRTDILNSPFYTTLLVLFVFHLGQYLAIPIFPVYYVRGLHLTDQQIAIGQSIFYVMVLLGSMQLARLSDRFGHKMLFGVSAAMMAIYPFQLALSHSYVPYLWLSALGGTIWAITGGAMPNYLLEKVPDDDRPAYLAWYNIILNAAILFGSLLGPLIADWAGLTISLFIFAFLRALSGWIVLKWG